MENFFFFLSCVDLCDALTEEHPVVHLEVRSFDKM